jgi:hypothetical protein
LHFEGREMRKSGNAALHFIQQSYFPFYTALSSLRLYLY